MVTLAVAIVVLTLFGVFGVLPDGSDDRLAHAEPEQDLVLDLPSVPPARPTRWAATTSEPVATSTPAATSSAVPTDVKPSAPLGLPEGSGSGKRVVYAISAQPTPVVVLR